MVTSHTKTALESYKIPILENSKAQIWNSYAMTYSNRNYIQLKVIQLTGRDSRAKNATTTSV